MNHQKYCELIGDNLGEYGSYYTYENNNEDIYDRAKFVNDHEDNWTRSFNDNSALIQSEVCLTYSDENMGEVGKYDGYYEYSDNIYSYNIDKNNSFKTENNTLSEESMHKRKSSRNDNDDDFENKIGCDNYDTGSQVSDEMYRLEGQHIYGKEILHDNEIGDGLSNYCGYLSHSDADTDGAHDKYEDYEQRQDDLYPVDDRTDGDWNEYYDEASTGSELSKINSSDCSSAHYRQARSICLKETRSSERSCRFEKCETYREEDSYYSNSDNNNIFSIQKAQRKRTTECSEAGTQQAFDASTNGIHYQNNLPVPYSNANFYQVEENSKMTSSDSITPPEEHQKREFYDMEYYNLPDHQNSLTYSNTDDVDFQDTTYIYDNSCKNCCSFPDQQVENVGYQHFHTNPHNNQSCNVYSNNESHCKELNSGIEYNYIVSQRRKNQHDINIDESEELNEYEYVPESDNQKISSEGGSRQHSCNFKYGSHQGGSRTFSGCNIFQGENKYELPYEALNHCWSDYQALHNLSGIKKNGINQKQQQSSSHYKYHSKCEKTFGHNFSLDHRSCIDSSHTLKSNHEIRSNYNSENGIEFDPSYKFYSPEAKFSNLNTRSSEKATNDRLCYGDPQKRSREKRTPYILKKNAANKEIECETNHSQTYERPYEYESYSVNYSRDLHSEAQSDYYVPDHEYSKKEWLKCCKRSTSGENTTKSCHYDYNGNVCLIDKVKFYNVPKGKKPSRNTYSKDPFQKVKTLKKKGNSHRSVLNEIVSVAENDSDLYLTDRNYKRYNTDSGWLLDRRDDKSNFSQNSLTQKSLTKATKWQSLTDTEKTQTRYHNEVNSKKRQRIQKNNNIRKSLVKIKKKSATKNRFPKRSTESLENMNLAIKNRAETENLDMLIFCQKDNAEQFSTHNNVNDDFLNEKFHGLKSHQKLNKKRLERKPVKSTVCQRNSVVMDVVGAKSKARLSEEVKGFHLTRRKNKENNNCKQQGNLASITKMRKIKKKNSKGKGKKRKNQFLREALKSNAFLKDIRLRKVNKKKVLHITKEPGEKIKNEILDKLHELKSKRQKKLNTNLNHMRMFSSAIGKFQRNQQELSQKCSSLLQYEHQSFYSHNVNLNNQNKDLHDEMNLENLKNINKKASLKKSHETLKMARLSLARGNAVLREIESSKLKDKTAACERFQTAVNKVLINNFMKKSQKQKFISTATQTDDITFVVLEDAETEDWPPLPDLIDEFKYSELLYNNADIFPPPPPAKHIILSKTIDDDQEWPPLPSFVEVLELEKTVSLNKSFPITHICSVVNKERKLTEQVNDMNNIEIPSIIPSMNNKHVISRLLYPAECELVLLEIGEEVTVSFVFNHNAKNISLILWRLTNKFQHHIKKY